MQKSTNNSIISSIIELGAAYLIILIISIPLLEISAILKFSFFYFLLFYLPFYPILIKMPFSFIERFMINNILGLSYAGLYVFLDIYLKIPFSYFIISGFLIFIFSLFFSSKILIFLNEKK